MVEWTHTSDFEFIHILSMFEIWYHKNSQIDRQ